MILKDWLALNLSNRNLIWLNDLDPWFLIKKNYYFKEIIDNHRQRHSIEFHVNRFISNYENLKSYWLMSTFNAFWYPSFHTIILHSIGRRSSMSSVLWRTWTLHWGSRLAFSLSKKPSLLSQCSGSSQHRQHWAPSSYRVECIAGQLMLLKSHKIRGNIHLLVHTLG